MRYIALIGSTGSIGINVLKVVDRYPSEFRISSLAAGSNIKLLEKQVLKFKPRIVSVYSESKAETLKKKLRGRKVKVVSGEEGLLRACVDTKADRAVFALVGTKAIKAVCETVKARKDVAIANKESLVIAGKYIRNLAEKYKVKIIPIDSEHSGVWQCLQGRDKREIKNIYLTASGGPFLEKPVDSLRNITAEEALRHPRWKMGKKTTIDSATLMNKGLEVIEACNLFDMPCEKIKVLIHPQAVVHSIVEFIDGSNLAQLSVPDMRIPIQYALTYPKRVSNNRHTLDLVKTGKLTFRSPDRRQFPCLGLAYDAACRGGTMPAVMNAANEVMVDKFLNSEAAFLDIPKIVSRVMKKHKIKRKPSIDDILNSDAWARKETKDIV